MLNREDYPRFTIPLDYLERLGEDTGPFAFWMLNTLFPIQEHTFIGIYTDEDGVKHETWQHQYIPEYYDDEEELDAP